MVFRQLTAKEKEAFQKNREAFQKYLAEDEKTIEILDGIMGKGMYHALNTPEKRALWRAGYELKGPSCIYWTKNSNNCMFWTAAEEGDITDNDAYYYCLGAVMIKK